MNLLQNRRRSQMGVETMDRLCYIYINFRSLRKLNNKKINGEISSGRDIRERERLALEDEAWQLNIEEES
ncbi:hypothetical protein GcM1_026002, partial [Golovinomyces cichoracearum]